MSELEALLDSELTLANDTVEPIRVPANDSVLKLVSVGKRLEEVNGADEVVKNVDAASRLQSQMAVVLNQYANKELGFQEGDTFVASGTFIALSEVTRSKKDKRDAFTHHQIFNAEDHAAVVGKNGAEFKKYEVVGKFESISVEQAPSDKDSYTVDFEDDDNFDTMVYDVFAPTIILSKASIIDTATGNIVESLRSIEIPLTHSHLVLEKYIQPYNPS